MGWRPTAELQARLELEVAHKLDDFKAQELSNTLLAFASIQRAPAAELQTSIDREVARRLGEFNTRDVQEVLRAYTLLEHVPDGDLLMLLEERDRELNPGAHR